MWRRQRDRQTAAELAFHLERQAAENEAAGMDAAEARRQAFLALGSPERWREEGREARGGAWIENWGRDLRLALRGLARTPGFAAVAILTLALGIGANTAMFSVVEAVLLRPLPFAQGGRLSYIWETDTRHPGVQLPFSYPDFLDLRSTAGFSGMAAYALNDVPLTGLGEAAHVRSAAVSDNLFTLLGVNPAAGRGFLPGEDRPGALAGEDAAVLGHRLAASKFGSDKAALGKHIVLDGRPYRVIGVMGGGFQFPLDDHEDLWTTVAPLQVSSSGDPMTAQRGAHWLEVVARLQPETTATAAQAGLTATTNALALRYPNDDQYRRAELVSMLQSYTGETRPVLLLLLGAVGCVLLIACVNVAGLLLARAARRRREFALRAALGASRAAILRQLSCESLALGGLGVVAGLGIAQAAIRALVKLGPDDIVRLGQARLSPAVLLFALALGLGTALLFGLFPAFELTRSDRATNLGATLQTGGRGLGGGAPRGWRRGLISGQYGLALVVLVGAILMVHSLDRLMGIAPGFSAGHVLTATINVPDARYPTAASDAAYFDRLVDQLGRQPGVAFAAAAMPIPLDGNNIGGTFDWPDHPIPPAEQPSTRVSMVTPGYFSALAIPLLQGRGITAADVHAAPQVAVVNQTFARQFLGTRSPLGVRITPGISTFPGPEPAREIVGVVGDTKMSSLARPDPPMVYLPQDQVPLDGLNLVVRAHPGAETIAMSEIRDAVRGLDPNVPVFDLRPMSELLDTALAPSRFNALLLVLFAGLALLLAMVGLYAVMSQAVAQRRREIGIRVALGASRREVIAMVLREGMAMATMGVAAGLAIAWALSRTLAGMLSTNLYATSALDPLAFLGAPLLLLVVAWAACAPPARRAASADPMLALRLE